MHPQLAQYYDFSCFVEVDEALRMKRLQMREQERFEMFMKVWQQKELTYHQAYQIKSQCDAIIKDEKNLSI
jgi:pantothenate kinase